MKTIEVYVLEYFDDLCWVTAGLTTNTNEVEKWVKNRNHSYAVHTLELPVQVQSDY